MADRCCGDCRYFEWTWEDGGQCGQCHRYPASVPVLLGGEGAPMAYMALHGIVMTEFPVMLCDEWCGEWRGRDDGGGVPGGQA